MVSVAIYSLSFLILFTRVLSFFSWWVWLRSYQTGLSFQRSSSLFHGSFALFFLRSVGSGAYWNLPFGVPLAELMEWCCAVVWSWPPSGLALGPLGWDSGARPCQMLPKTAPGLPVRSCKAILSWQLPVLGLDACGKDYTENWRWLPWSKSDPSLSHSYP